MIIPISQVPYLKRVPNDGRILPLLHFYDREAGKWLYFCPHEDGKVLKLEFTRLVEGVYLSQSIQDTSIDVEIPLLSFLFQRFPKKETFNAFQRLRSDIQNSLSLIEKQRVLLRSYLERKESAYSELVNTEIEYALYNHRSSFDLLHEFVRSFLTEHVQPPPNLPESFRKMTQRQPHELIEKYKFPMPLAEFYVSRREIFMALRELRDLIAHRGGSPELTYCLDDGFGIGGSSSKFSSILKSAGIWERLSPRENDIASVLAFLAFLAKDIQVSLNAFTEAFAKCFRELPTETAPGYFVFSRFRFANHLLGLDRMLEDPWSKSFYESSAATVAVS